MSFLTRFLRIRSQSGRSSLQSLHTTGAIAGAMLVAATAASAQGANGNANYPARDELAQAQQVCETVIHFRPGEARFDACVSSLVVSLSSVNRDHAAIQAIGNAEDPETYVGTSFDAVFHREQQACAHLGFDPAFSAFTNCVGNLQANLEWLDFPNS
jgi:hypothetical protein